MDGFCSFAALDMLEHPWFKEILCAFRAYYGLEAFTLKQLDQYLWQLGKEKFPKQY